MLNIPIGLLGDPLGSGNFTHPHFSFDSLVNVLLAELALRIVFTASDAISLRADQTWKDEEPRNALLASRESISQ